MVGPMDMQRRLVDEAFVAALDESRWGRWSAMLCEAVGSTGALFTVVDGRTQTLVHGIPHGFSNRAVDDYFAGMHRLDPQIPHAMSLRRSTIYLDSDHIDRSHPRTAEWLRWSDDITGHHHHMTAMAVLGGGRWRAGVALHRNAGAGPTPAEEQRGLHAIFPDLIRAWELALVHGEKLAEAHWEGLLACRAEPALLLDEHRRILRATPAAEALLAAADGLDAEGGRLCAGESRVDAALGIVTAAAVAPAGARSGTVRIPRRSGRAPYLLTAYPLARRRTMFPPADAVALVTLVDPAMAPVSSVERLTDAFDFTPREAELAALLIAGHSVESAAAVQAIGMATARTHLRALLAKTGTGRQAEMLQLLTRIG